MIYLFLMSVIPTVPAAWLTFAEGSVYEAYDGPVRVWGLSVTDDQQLAGAIMKVGGSIFLWSIIVVLWFRRFASSYRDEHQYRRGHLMPTAEIVGHDEDPLTYDDVAREFARQPAASEPEPTGRFGRCDRRPAAARRPRGGAQGDGPPRRSGAPRAARRSGRARRPAARPDGASATRRGPGSTSCRSRSARCAATATWPRPRRARPRAASWATSSSSWPREHDELSSPAARAAAGDPEPHPPRRPGRRVGRRQPGRQRSAPPAGRRSPTTSASRTGTRARRSGSSTSSGRSRSAARCS